MRHPSGACTVDGAIDFNRRNLVLACHDMSHAAGVNTVLAGEDFPVWSFRWNLSDHN